MSTLEDILNWTIPYLNVQVGDFIIIVIITVVLAAILFLVGMGTIRGLLRRVKAPPLLTEMMLRIVRAVFGFVVLVVFLSLIGFNVTSLILAFATVIGLIVGFGMQETMNNFFGGVFIAINRPIEKGELVTVNSMTGTVEDVTMMYTRLTTFDNELLIIPNGKVWGEPIVNKVRKGVRRVDVNVAVPYESDLRAAVQATVRMMRENPRVREDPEPSVYMAELDDSCVKIQLRPWTEADDYWTLAGEMRQGALDALGEVGIKVPFPQLDIHVKDGPGGTPFPA